MQQRTRYQNHRANEPFTATRTSPPYHFPFPLAAARLEGDVTPQRASEQTEKVFMVPKIFRILYKLYLLFAHL